MKAKKTIRKRFPKAEDEIERRVVADVKKYGWHVVSIQGDEQGPSFSYSVGLVHTFEHPEIFVMGLSHEVASAFINEIGLRVKKGQSFGLRSRPRGIAEGMALGFVNFGKRYIREYLGCARWFYKPADFPVLQMVWPDGAGKFPWDDKFNGQLFEHQLLLCEDVTKCWPFHDARNTVAFVHAAIFKSKEPIIHVVHEKDGDWQFLDGISTNANRNAMIVALSEVVKRDPSVLELADLPRGWSATRKELGSPWQRVAPARRKKK